MIVIGTSAGGLPVLKTLVAGLAAELPAALFIVQHTTATAPGLLPQLLDRVSALPVVQATDGEPIRRQRIYLAPPDHHLLVTRDRVRVVRGPQENGVRPAIDPLFRAAAAAYGPRVIGVILTGLLSDGTAGLQAVKQRGGLAIVQDPQEAAYPWMPRNALQAVAVDYCLPVAELPALLSRLVAEPAPEEAAFPLADSLALETRIAEQELTSQELLASVEQLGTRTTYTCPACNGTLWHVRANGGERFRCHVGHAYTAEAWESAQTTHLEQALWSAVRVMEEKAAFARQMAARRARQGMVAGAERYTRHGQELEQEVKLIRGVLLRGAATQQPTSSELAEDPSGRVPPGNGHRTDD